MKHRLRIGSSIGIQLRVEPKKRNKTQDRFKHRNTVQGRFKNLNTDCFEELMTKIFALNYIKFESSNLEIKCL